MPPNAPHGMRGFLEIRSDFAAFRPVAVVSLGAGIKMVEEAIAYCAENGITRLLLDVTGLTGFKPPTLAERYHGISQWADTSRGRIRIAEIDRVEQLDPTETNTVIAKNRGLELRVFTDEKEAVEWLLA